ncbi:hypothetical protein GOODEAATRI_014462 [Goodea atripinnis]|uniref:Pre-mRNA-splicing factor CWC21 n=1 Tax=Goodea atripinnis TaxID=208336 RepID=A0ABV0NK92_9TELE
MYNGIGLTTPRGSGTNGYVQRNLSSLRVKRPRDERGGERDEKDRERLESQLNRQPNADILEHQRKRQLEVKSNQQKNDRLRAAFGISSDYVDGSSFHADRKEKEKEKREQERLERERLQQQKYT